MRVIVTAPTTISTEPSSHIVHTIGYPLSLRVRFTTPQPQVPHRLYKFHTQTKPQISINYHKTLTTLQKP